MAKKKKLRSKIWAWVQWPYDLYKKAKQWVLRTSVWKRLEAMEYDPPPFPLTWWITRGGAIVLILMTTHYWSYRHGRSEQAMASGSIVGFVSAPADHSSELAAAEKSVKRWKGLAARVGADNHELYKTIEQMKREIAALRAKAGEKKNLAAVSKPMKKAVKKYYKPKPKPKAKPAASTWLNPL